MKKSKQNKIEMGYVVLLRSGKGAHHNRTKAVRKGSSRKVKHKGRGW